MKNDTSYREKGRAAFLAAIMVLSMVAVPAAFAGATAAQTTEYTTSQLDGQVFFGEEITISGFDEDETVQIRGGDDEDSSHIRNEVTNGTELVLDTSGLPTDEYDEFIVRNSTGANYGPFEVTQQNVDFEFADEQVQAEGETTLNFESDNRREPVNVTVTSESLDSDDLDGIFTGATTSENDDGDLVLEGVEYEDELTADFSGIELGNYTVDLEVVDTGATDDATVEVVEEVDASAQFGTDTVTEEVGDVAEFEVDTSGGASEVWLSLVDEDENFNVTAELTDVSDDETVTVSWNTHQALNETEDVGLSAENANVGEVTANGNAYESGAETIPNREAGWTFDVESYTSEGAVNDGDFSDILLIDLQQRSTGNLTVHTAPGVNAHSTDSEIQNILDDATERQQIAENDLLIAEVNVSGVFGYLNTDPDQFGTNGLDFELVGEAGDFGDGASTNLSDINESVSIVDQPENNTIYFVIDSGALDMDDGETRDAQFTIEGENNDYVENANEDDVDETAASEFTFENREIEFDGDFNNDQLVLTADSEAEITAETNVAPGTSANLRVNLQREYRTHSGEVSEDGTYTATVDLSGFEEGTQARSVRVRAPNSATQQSVEGIIGQGDAASFSASGDAPSNVEVDGDAQLDVTVTNDGGVSDSAEISVTVDGEEVASESAELESGGTWEESYDIPTDEEGDVDWEVSTQHDTASGTVTVGESPEGGDDPAGDDPDNNETPADGDGDGDGDGQPGFGVFVALFALIGAALLALRRQN